MKKIFLALTIISALVLTSCGKAQMNADGSFVDFDEAAEYAQKKNQDIMVIITTVGDDEQSGDFVDKVVKNANFKKDVASKYAVVRMDFGEAAYQETVAGEGATAAEQKAAEKKAAQLQKNMNYARMLNVSDTPVVYLLSKEKYLISGLFYDDENRTLEGFKSLLAEKDSVIDDMHKMIYQTKIGTNQEKVEAINALYEATSPGYRLFLCDLVSSVEKLDPENKTGLVGNLAYEAAALRSDKAILLGNIKEAVDAFLEVENNKYIPAESKQQAPYTAAYMCSMTEMEEVSVIISYLEKAIEIAPESEDVPAIKRVIAALSSQAE